VATSPSVWRLLLEPHPRPGALNMAIDETILRAVVAGQSPPTLRLYGWSPTTLTLGRGQPCADADVGALERDGVDLVRRMTGGTAVLNRDELTYTIAVADSDPRLAGTIAESYRAAGVALVSALARLGLMTAEIRPRDRGGAYGSSRGRTPVCFEIPSDYEVTVGGRKLVGSAQMRVRGGVLQHGSLPLRGDIGAISAYLTQRPDPERIRSFAITLQEALGRTVGWTEAAVALVAAFRDILALSLIESPLSRDERVQAERLLVTKYGDPGWTSRL